MSKYKSRISKDSEGSFYALVVRIDNDGFEQLDPSYKGRHFKSLKAAENSTEKHIKSFDL